MATTSTATTKSAPKSILKHHHNIGKCQLYEPNRHYDLESQSKEPKQKHETIFYTDDKEIMMKNNDNADDDDDDDELINNYKLEMKNLRKKTYLLHNNELSKEIIKLIMYSTDIFLKKILIEFQLKNDFELFHNVKNKKAEFLVKLKEFLLINNTNNKNINDEKLNKNIINLMQNCHFMLSQPELPVDKSLINIDKKFIKKYHHNNKPKQFKLKQCITTPDIAAAHNDKHNTVSYSFTENEYQTNTKSYSLFDPIKKHQHTNTNHYILFKTFRSQSIQPLVKELNRKKYFNKKFDVDTSDDSDDTSDEDDDDVSSLSSTSSSSTSDDDFQIHKKNIFNRLNLKEKSVAIFEANKKCKKLVRFADSLGLDLASVKIISNNSFDSLPMNSTPQTFDFDLFTPSFLLNNKLYDVKEEHSSNFHLVIVPKFELHNYEQNIVTFDSYIYDHNNRMIKCVCKCKNIAFNKIVYAHTTFNNWQTYANYDAKYVSSSGDYDFFEFCIFLPDLKTQYSSIAYELNKCLLNVEFAICFICNNQTYWDNNKARNYLFEFYLQRD